MSFYQRPDALGYEPSLFCSFPSPPFPPYNVGTTYHRYPLKDPIPCLNQKGCVSIFLHQPREAAHCSPRA